MAKKNPVKDPRGGPREGAGRPGRDTPVAYINMKVEPEEKAAFIAAAKRSEHKNLSRWLVAAAKSALINQ